MPEAQAGQCDSCGKAERIDRYSRTHRLARIPITGNQLVRLCRACIEEALKPTSNCGCGGPIYCRQCE